MNTLYHDIVIDLNHMGFPESVTVKQYDDQIPHVRIELRQNGAKYMIPSGTTLRMQGTKPDGTHFMHDVIRTDDGRVDCPLTNQILAAAGPILAEVCMTDTTGELTTFNFYILAQKAALSREEIESSDDYESIDKIREETKKYKEQAEAAKTAAESAKEAATKSANTATQQAQTAQLEAQKVKQIVAGNEAYTKTESDLKYTVAPRKEASSDTGELKLTDADEGLSYLALQGNSEQYTNTANKNLFDLEYQKLYGINENRYLNVNGVIITPTTDKDWKISYYIKVKPSTVYAFTDLPTSLVACTVFYTKDKTFISSITNANIITNTNKITTPSNCEYIRISFRAMVENTLQLEEGETATEYVKGAVEAPSPEYPSEVRSVGDIPKDVNGVEIKNLLDEEWIKSQPESAWVKAVSGSNTQFTLKLGDELKKKVMATAFFKNALPSGKSFSFTLGNQAGVAGISLIYNNTIGTGTADYATAEYVNLYITVNGTTTATHEQMLEVFNYFNFMVTEAAEIDEYRPYIGENNGLVKLESIGINRADTGNGPISMASENSIEVNTWTPRRIVLTQKNKNNSWAYVKLNVERGKKYTFYCKAKVEVIEGTPTDGVTHIGFRQYPPGGVMHGQITLLQDGQYRDIYNTVGVVPDDVPNIAFMLYLSSSSATNGNVKMTIDDLMVVEGTKTLQEMKALKFQPYHQQITWIPLKEPLQGMYSLYDTIDKNGYVTQRYDYNMTRLRDCVGISGWRENAFAMYFVDSVNTKRFVVGGLAYSDVAYVSNPATAGKPVMITTQGFSERAGWYFAYYFLYGYLGIDKDATDAANKQRILDALGTDYEIKTWYRLIDPITYQIPAVYIETHDPETNVRCLNKVKPSDMTLDYKLAMSSLIKRLEALESKTVQEV